MDVMKKSVLITNIPNPYRVPLFNELSKQLKNDNIHLKIIFDLAYIIRVHFVLYQSMFEEPLTLVQLLLCLVICHATQEDVQTQELLYQELYVR
jgi:hypothetical protein